MKPLPILLIAAGAAFMLKDQIADFFNGGEAPDTTAGFSTWKKQMEEAAAAAIAKPLDDAAREGFQMLLTRAQLRVIEGVWKMEDVKTFAQQLEAKVSAARNAAYAALPIPPNSNAPFPPVIAIQPTAPPPTTTAPPPPATVSPATNFSQYIANIMGPGRHMAGADTWNAYYSQWSGVQQTADLFDPADRGALISLTEYLSRRTNAGLSGIRGFRVGQLEPMKVWQ